MAEDALKVSFKMTGISILRLKFNRLNEDIRRKVIKRAAVSAMRPVLITSRNKLAALAKEPTGALRKSLTIEEWPRGFNGSTSKAGSMGASVRAGTRSELGIKTGQPYYPNLFEYGYVQTGKFKNKMQPPRPFLRNSFAQKQRTVKFIFIRSIKKQVKKIFRF